MPTFHSGRHELGQNFLVDTSVARSIVDLAAITSGPIVEIGAGAGALTVPLQRLGRPLTAVEIDERLVRELRRSTVPPTRVVHADFLRWRLPTAPYVVVGNLPFHQTTAVLRRLLHAGHWTDAVLLVQWEVARRRAGVGGASMMTAQWWPWFEFRLVSKVSASAFVPRPGVDGGLLTITRRAEPLVQSEDRDAYQRLVHRVFTGRGRGLTQIVRSARPGVPKAAVASWMRANGLVDSDLPKSLAAHHWAELFALASPVRTAGRSRNSAPSPGRTRGPSTRRNASHTDT